MQVIQAGIEKAEGHRRATAAHRPRGRSSIESIKGKIKMRECDHQAVQQGFMVKVVKKDGFDHPDPRGDRDLPGRAHHAGLQEDHLRRLIRVSGAALGPCPFG